MDAQLKTLLDHIGRQHADRIAPDGRHYMEVDIGREARELGLGELSARFASAFVVVPLKAPLPGMKVRIDGRTFITTGGILRTWPCRACGRGGRDAVRDLSRQRQHDSQFRLSTCRRPFTAPPHTCPAP